ncbi:MAG: GNAT family N-acetyltransferase [Verrucomicrobiae bacterium]|nr:GNAT family N-acetyltransferase [Verrucomicrobiae bacterium]
MRDDNIDFLPIQHVPGATESVIAWILETWGDSRDDGDSDFRQRIEGRSSNPEAMVAVLDKTPVGAVTFRRYDVPGGEQRALWIDALYVSIQHRRNGIGSKLIQTAESISALSEERLYAFTGIPKIYEAKGWSFYQGDSQSVNWIVVKFSANRHQLGRPSYSLSGKRLPLLIQL